MIDKIRLQRLQQIASLIRDRDLSRLSVASAAKAKTESLLTALDQTQSQAPADLGTTVTAHLESRYGTWKANRRISLNQQLARDTVDWMQVRSEAQRAFGRSVVLEKLNKKA